MAKNTFLAYIADNNNHLAFAATATPAESDQWNGFSTIPDTITNGSPPAICAVGSNIVVAYVDNATSLVFLTIYDGSSWTQPGYPIYDGFIGLTAPTLISPDGETVLMAYVDGFIPPPVPELPPNYSIVIAKSQSPFTKWTSMLRTQAIGQPAQPTLGVLPDNNFVLITCNNDKLQNTLVGIAFVNGGTAQLEGIFYNQSPVSLAPAITTVGSHLVIVYASDDGTNDLHVTYTSSINISDLKDVTVSIPVPIMASETGRCSSAFSPSLTVDGANLVLAFIDSLNKNQVTVLTSTFSPNNEEGDIFQWSQKLTVDGSSMPEPLTSPASPALCVSAIKLPGPHKPPHHSDNKTLATEVANLVIERIEVARNEDSHSGV